MQCTPKFKRGWPLHVMLPQVADMARLQSFTPTQIAEVYQLPKSQGPSTIGLLELGGGYQLSDYPADIQSRLSSFGVGGAENTPGSEADMEVALDIWMASIAPEAQIIVGFGPNDDAGFPLLLAEFLKRKVDVVSVSWGSPETQWSPEAITAVEAALKALYDAGIPVFVAAGDNGVDDGTGEVVADYPASSPYAIGCGGTRLMKAGDSYAEMVWNDGSRGGATGGAVSTLFTSAVFADLTRWTVTSKKIPMNGKTASTLVAGNADPATGYVITCDGQEQVIGGTSAVAPLWAAVAALTGKSSAFLPQNLIKLGESSFYDVTHGNNSFDGVNGYQAAPGWDICTGYGSPNGTSIAAALGLK